MDASLATLLATLIGGAIGLIGSYINNRHQLQLDKQQAEQKAQLELQQSLRTQLTDTYTNCICALARLDTHIQNYSHPLENPEIELQRNTLVTEAYTHLQHLLIYAPPTISTDTYNTLQRAIIHGQTPWLLERSDTFIISLQQIVQTLAKLDPRLGLARTDTDTVKSLEKYLNDLAKSLPTTSS